MISEEKIEEMAFDKSKNVEVPHFSKSFSERAGHIATFKDGFKEGYRAPSERRKMKLAPKRILQTMQDLWKKTKN